MAGWTNLTPSAAALAAGNAYLYEDAGALKYQGTSGAGTMIVAADGTLQGGTGANAAAVGMLSTYYYKTPSSNSSTAPPVNRSFYLPIFIAETTTIDRIACRAGSTFSGTASIRLGIYADSGWQPSSLVLDAGTVSCTAANAIYQITISQSLSAGLYWLCFNTVTAATTNNFVSANASYLQMPVGTSVSSSMVTSLIQDVNVSSAFPSTAAYTGTVSNTADVWIRKA